MAKEISRRNFLKGAAATALSAAVVGVTKPLAFADEAPAAEESGTWYDAKYFAKPDPITDIAETVETDVVVVGAGNGGLVAAASAAIAFAFIDLFIYFSIDFFTFHSHFPCYPASASVAVILR